MKFTRTILVAAIVGILSIEVGFITSPELNLSQYILHLSFSGIEMHQAYIAMLSYRYMPLLIFQLVYGVYIYRHFCCASIYFFSRNVNRINWFLKETGGLYGYIMIYLLIMSITQMLILSLFSKIIVDSAAVTLILYYFLIYSLYLFMTTLAINVVAIIFNSNIGFIAVESVILLSMATFLLFGKVMKETNVILLKMDIIANLVFPIHSSQKEHLNHLLNKGEIHFDLNFSVVYYLILSVILVVVGCIVVKTREFIINDREAG